MALSLRQLKARRAYIGGSDAPVILGLSKWRNIGDLYAEKAGLTEVKVTESEAANLGDLLEPTMCKWVGKRLGVKVKRGVKCMSPDTILRAQLDGWIPDLNETVEVKTSGLLSPVWRAEEEGWGPGGTDAVPYHVIAQVQFGLMLAEAERCHVAAFLGNGVGPRHYVIEAMPDLQREIEARCRAFWFEHVIPRIPPSETPRIETLKILRREPGKTIAIDEELVEAYEAAREAEADAKTEKEEAARALIAALGDAEAGLSPFGGVTYTPNAKGVRSLRLTKGTPA